MYIFVLKPGGFAFCLNGFEGEKNNKKKQANRQHATKADVSPMTEGAISQRDLRTRMELDRRQ